MKPEYDLLLSAAQKNATPKVYELIQQQGVPVDHSNAVGQTALHIACLWGHVDTVEALLLLGAPVNAKNKLGGSTPLHMAAGGRGKPEDLSKVLDLLIAHEADKSIADNSGRMAFDMTERPEWREKLAPAPPAWWQAIQDADVSKFNRILHDEEPHHFFAALQYRDKSAVEWVLDQIVETHDPSSASSSADEYTAAVQMLQLLPKYTSLAIPNEPDSALYELIHNQHCTDPVLLPILLPYGPPDHWWQMMHRAARKDKLRTLQYCLEHLQIPPNTPGPQGMTALHFAARSGQMKTLNHLLSLPDIDLDATNELGQTALDAARVNQKDEAVAVLSEAAAQRS